MKYTYALLLLYAAETDISADSLRRALESAGADADPERTEALGHLSREDVARKLNGAGEGELGVGPGVYAALLLNASDSDIAAWSLRNTLDAAGADVTESQVAELVASVASLDLDAMFGDIGPLTWEG